MNTIEMDAMKAKLARKILNETDNVERKPVATTEYLTNDEFWNASSQRLGTICRKHGLLQ